MTQTESIMELLPLISRIEMDANFMCIYPVNISKAGVAQLKRKLFLLGIRDIPEMPHKQNHIELNYTFAIDSVRKVLDKIIAMKNPKNANVTIRVMEQNVRSR